MGENKCMDKRKNFHSMLLSNALTLRYDITSCDITPFGAM